MTKRVAVTDYTFPDLELERTILAPHELIAGQCKSGVGLSDLVAQADAVITQFAPVTRDVIAAMQQAKAIVRYGIGVDNVDLEAARERGIPVCNVPDYCIDEVADHTLAFILASTRSVVSNCAGVREGQWKLAVPLERMKTLSDLTVGIVGFGRIGQEVAKRLAPFKCRRLVSDPLANVADSVGWEIVELERLLKESDIVTLHCPSTAQTRQMINAESLAKMMPGAILINLARGDLVDTSALVSALQSGQVSAAALDVCDPEPIPADHPLLKMENVIVAAHIASTSMNAVRKLRETAAQLALAAVRGEPLWNVVNGAKA